MKIWTRLCVALLAAALTVGAQAEVVKLRFVGGLELIGSGNPTPFSFELVYDTALNTSHAVALTGELIDGVFSAQNDFYGYSRSGIVSTNFSFDGTSWTVDDLSATVITSNFGADFFFDADIASATPTRAALTFIDTRSLFVGGLSSFGLGGPRLLLLNDAALIPGVDGGDLYGPFSVSREVLAAEVPEPSSMALLVLAVLALCAPLRRRR